MIVRREEIKKVREVNERNDDSHRWKKMVMTEWQEKKTRKNKMVMLEIIVGKNKTREKEKQIVIAECVEKKSNYGWNDVKRRKEKK